MYLRTSGLFKALEALDVDEGILPAMRFKDLLAQVCL